MALLTEYRALLKTNKALDIKHRTLVTCRARNCRALLTEHRALLTEYRALLKTNKALYIKYRTLVKM